MFNCNGVIVSQLTEVEPELIESLHSDFSIYETLRFYQGKLLFWELHYFRMIACLRRLRFVIPMTYTMENLEAEINKLLEAYKNLTNDNLLKIQFINNGKKTQFIISIIKPSPFIARNSKYSIDLYKENFISSGNLSNLSINNRGLRLIAKSFAEENGLDDVIIMNEFKQVAETLKGSLYLLQSNQLITPKLEAGCQDFALRTEFNNWLNKKTNIYDIIEKDINSFELQRSEEVLVLSLKKGLQSVSNYRKTSFTQKKVNQIFNEFIASLI